MEDCNVLNSNEIVWLIQHLVDHGVLQEEKVVKAEQEEFIVVDRHSLLAHEPWFSTASAALPAVTLAVPIAIQVT